HIHGGLPVGRKAQPGALDEHRKRHDPCKDRHGVDARVADAEAAGLPDPFLTRVPLAHALPPVDANRSHAFVLEDEPRCIHGGVVARVPGLEEHALLLFAIGDEVLELGDRRRRRLFQQHVLAGVDRLAHIGVAHSGRGADGDQLDLGHRPVELRRRLEHRHVAMPDAAGGDAGRQREVPALLDHRQVLVLRDLADADDGDLLLGHAVLPRNIDRYQAGPVVTCRSGIGARRQRMRIALKSLTLVPVGPVTSSPPMARKALYASLFRSAASGSMPAARIRVALVPSAIAPALSPAPSMPSVSAASAVMPSTPSMAMAKARRNSAWRPPRPSPRMVTVVSPPDSRTAGRANGRWRSRTSRAIAA